MSCVKCHVSCVTCHVSRVTCHMSRVTCHMSHVRCHFFLFFSGQSGEAYRWRVCYQRVLPGLVFFLKGEGLRGRGSIFTDSAPLGRVGLRVAMSVFLFVCAIGCSFFSRPLIGPQITSVWLFLGLFYQNEGWSWKLMKLSLHYTAQKKESFQGQLHLIKIKNITSWVKGSSYISFASTTNFINS